NPTPFPARRDEPPPRQTPTYISPTPKVSPAVVTPPRDIPPEPAAPRKAPVPNASSQADAEKVIKSLFKEDYAKHQHEDRLVLSNKLLKQGLDTRDDPVARFVLWREARDLAVQAGNTPAAMKAIEEIGRSYEVDALAMKAAALEAVSRSASEAGN